MTEAGEKWVDEKNAYREKYHPSWGSENAYETPERWIRAFCDEVERRYQESCPRSIMPDRAHWLILCELKRELLGDQREDERGEFRCPVETSSYGRRPTRNGATGAVRDYAKIKA